MMDPIKPEHIINTQIGQLGYAFLLSGVGEMWLPSQV